MGARKNKELGGYLVPAVVIGMAVTNLASCKGYERICVAISDTEVQCVPTNKVEKYLSGMGLQGLRLPSQQGSNSLLVCDKGKVHPINLQGGPIDKVFHYGTMPYPCAPPVALAANKVKRYGPRGETGGRLCNGRTTPDSCKDCCLALGVAQAGAVAAAGHTYRGTKPPPKLLVAEAVVEAIIYGVIYWNRQACDSNCEVSYEEKERTR